MAKRLFYNLEIRAQRVMAEDGYTDVEDVDPSHDAGLRVCVDARYASDRNALGVIFRHVIDAMEVFYAKRDAEVVSEE